MADLGNTYERSMYYGAKETTKQRAKKLRSAQTKEEKLLWEQLRNNKIQGLKFRRQHPIDIYIADFYCHKIQLVIEIDGGFHSTDDQKNWDDNRSAMMKSFNISIIRFTNDQINNNLSQVLIDISQKCKTLLTHYNTFNP